MSVSALSDTKGMIISMKKNVIMNNKNGSALLMVLVAFMFISILIASVFIMTVSNTKQVQLQNYGVQSYYIARSGAEATYQALTTSDPSLLTQFASGSLSRSDTISFEEGTTDITVVGYNEGTKRRIRITSVGEVNGTNVSRVAILEFNYEDYGDVKWSR